MKILSFVITILFSTFLLAAAPQRMPWASPIHWDSLQKYADTITASELEELLQDIYVPDGSWKKWITITPQAALIEPGPGMEQITLPLAASNEARKPVPRYWKKHPGAQATKEKPLAGLFIVIDPGHLGGAWGKMEERWFRIGHSMPVEEGTMTLIEAKILAKRLRSLGAKVELTRNHLGPTTPLRPSQLRQAAMADFQAEGKTFWTSGQLKKREEILFYRTAEIHHRADCINNVMHPDLVICLHFDAEEWGNPKHPKLTDAERVHFLIGGDFNESELQTEGDRYAMLTKLLGRAHHEEVGVADAVAHSFVEVTGLPPFIYHNPTKARAALPSSLYLWNRNLLATRLYQAPVLYCEAYVMNDREVFQRIQLGDYNGTRTIGSRQFRSIYRDYADAVTQGVRDYFRKDSL